MALTRDELLEVWRSVLPESYTDPLEEQADGRGVDVIAAIAAMWARVAASVETSTQAMYLYTHSEQAAPEAAGEAEATGTVNLTRAVPTTGVLNLEEGDPLLVELVTLDGETIFEAGLELAADIALAESTTPAAATVRAARPGYQGNVPDTRGRTVVFQRRTVISLTNATTTATNTLTAAVSGDQLDEGMVGAFAVFTAGPNYGTGPRRISYDRSTGVYTLDGAALVASALNALQVVDVNDLGVTAELAGDLAGGVHGWLDELGRERKIGRNANETDTEYRNRVRELPDVVAPNAILRAARRVLEPIPIDFRVMESRDRVQFPGLVGGAVDFTACDDPNVSIFPEDDHQNFCQGDRFDRQGFYVVVERQDYGDPGWPAGIKFPLGVHPSNAADYCACDGAPFAFWSDLQRLIAEIEKKRMAGVPWLLVLVDSIP